MTSDSLRKLMLEWADELDADARAEGFGGGSGIAKQIRAKVAAAQTAPAVSADSPTKAAINRAWMGFCERNSSKDAFADVVRALFRPTTTSAAVSADKPDAGLLDHIANAFRVEADADANLRDGQERLTAFDYFKRGWTAAGRPATARASVGGEPLQSVKDLLDEIASFQELNEHNYSQEDLAELNNWGVMVWERAEGLRKAMADAPSASAASVDAKDAPPNSLPTWSECAMRVENSDFIAKRVAEGGYGAESDSLLASALHRFIYEYDDANPYRSAWFMHRLEIVLQECAAITAQREKDGK